MIINTNMASLNTLRQLGNNEKSTRGSLEKLSSGLRINSAADDAAGLAISEKMRGQISGLNKATSNAQDAISLVSTAEGALNETTSILQRMRELAVQGSNDTNTTTDRGAMQTEINQLTSEVNRIGNTTEFNTKKLLNGDFDHKIATAEVTKAGLALSSATIITNSDTKGTVVGGAYATAGNRAVKATAAGAQGNLVANATAIAAGTNNELTLNVDGVEKHVIFADATAGSAALTEINTKLALVGANAKYDASNKLVIQSNTLGNGGSIQVLGGGFTTAFVSADVSTIGKIAGTDVNDALVHGDTGANVTGSVNVSNTGTASLTATPIIVAAAAGMNELTINVDGTEKTFTLSDKTYDGTTGKDQAQLVTDLQAAITTAGLAATVSVDSSNKLVLTSNTTTLTSSVEVKGGGLADKMFGVVAGRISQARQADNSSLTINVDGSPKTVAIAKQTYQDLNEFISVNTAAFTAQGVTVSNEGGTLKLTSISSGIASEVKGLTDSDLTKQLGLVNSDGTALAAGNFVKGANGNTTLTVTVDGETKDAVIQQGNYTDKKVLAAAIESAINNVTTTAADVKVTVDDQGKLVITSGKTGSTSDVTIGAHATKDAAGILGLTTNVKTAGTDEAKAELNFQIGANSGQFLALSVHDMRSTALGISGTTSGATVTASNGKQASMLAVVSASNGSDSTNTEYTLDLSTAAKATAAISIIDDATTKVSAERSNLGAVQNRLEHTINNLGTSSQNITTAEANIRDVDMAKEMTNFQKNNILQQAAQSMLAQANQQGQGVLKLLQ